MKVSIAVNASLFSVLLTAGLFLRCDFYFVMFQKRIVYDIVGCFWPLDGRLLKLQFPVRAT